uniref:hypothetical protein n=1 Tax=Vibrio salilacus TaxID=1323749 RepID=UPI001C12A83A
AVLCQINQSFVVKHNKQFKQTLNARRFWFALKFVLPSNAESEPVRFGLLNWALCNKRSSEYKMSETTSTVFKILSSLTSTKASVKYISIGVFLLLSWSKVSLLIAKFNVPTEQKNLIVLFVSLGLGSLIGELIYKIINGIWSKYQNSRKQSRERLEKENFNTELLVRFKKVYPYFDYETKRLFYRLSKGERCLEWGYDEVDVPLKNGYVCKVANIDRERDIFRIHPALISYVVKEWAKEVELQLNNFRNDVSPYKETFLKLMATEKDQCGDSIDREVIEFVNNHRAIFQIEADDHEGFYITTYEPYVSECEKQLNIALLEEKHVLKRRIVMEKTVA